MDFLVHTTPNFLFHSFKCRRCKYFESMVWQYFEFINKISEIRLFDKLDYWDCFSEVKIFINTKMY